MKINEFLEQFNARYPDVDRNNVATTEMITDYEDQFGYQLPTSFKKFLSNFSNGIFLLDCEPIGGVGSSTPCGDISLVNRNLPEIPPKVIVTETNEEIDSSQLISFTTYDASEQSNDHWVFICNEEGIENNEYRVGFISQSSLKIVKVLRNFEEWLTYLWENDVDDEVLKPVFHILYPTFEQRAELLFDWWKE